MSTKIVLKNVRLAFPCLFTPQQVNGQGKPAFSASLLIDPATSEGKANLAALDKALEAAATKKWAGKGAAQLAALKKADKVALHDGDTKSDYAGFAGTMYVSARNTVRPGVFNKDKSPVTEEDGVVYGGCYVNASVEMWGQDNQFGKRINATLLGVQFVKDGDAFSGGGSSSGDEFETLDAEEEDSLID